MDNCVGSNMGRRRWERIWLGRLGVGVEKDLDLDGGAQNRLMLFFDSFYIRRRGIPRSMHVYFHT